MKKIKLTDCLLGQWKNGLGKTRQVSISPEEATLLENNFHWRLSSATISGDNSFSKFADFKRWLIVWKGEGLLLNNKLLMPHIPFHFIGNDLIECSLIADEVIDLGIIYDPKFCRVDLKTLELKKDEFIDLISSDLVIVFLAKGEILADHSRIIEGDFIFLKNEALKILSLNDTILYLFSVEHF